MTRDARGEAAELAGAAREDVRVLEPSPPAVTVEPFHADDPLEPGGRLTPLSTTDGERGSWDTWLASHPEQRDWASQRWLTGRRSLDPLPADLTRTRLALHRLAVYVLSPARRRANGKIALRWTLGGFGTPFFGRDEQVRVLGARLVRECDGASEEAPVTTLAEAAAFVLAGPPDLEWAEGFDVPDAGDWNAALAVDDAAAAWLGDWFGLGTRVLEQLRADAGALDTRVQLWPEHFDLAVSLPVRGAAATFGVSPGDAGHEQPYLYVLPGREVTPGSSWNADGFTGAVLAASGVRADPVETALGFFRSVLAEIPEV